MSVWPYETVWGNLNFLTAIPEGRLKLPKVVFLIFSKIFLFIFVLIHQIDRNTLLLWIISNQKWYFIGCKGQNCSSMQYQILTFLHLSFYICLMAKFWINNIFSGAGGDPDLHPDQGVNTEQYYQEQYDQYYRYRY